MWYYFAEQSDSAAKCIFFSKSISFKGGNLFNLTCHVRRTHPTLSLSIERFTPAHNPAGNETRNTNPDDSEIAQPISSNEEASNPQDTAFRISASNINRRA
jgi:hypothetical protein